MKTLITKTSAALASGVLLCALAAPANALIISYDDIVTGAIPDSPAPWMTASITNGTSGGLNGVNVTLTPRVVAPEFITSIFFSLRGEYTLSDPTTTPDFTDACNGSAPAGTGPWQMCMSFSASDQWNTSDGAVSFFLRGIRESNFVYNSDGWRSVAGARPGHRRRPELLVVGGRLHRPGWHRSVEDRRVHHDDLRARARHARPAWPGPGRIGLSRRRSRVTA